MEFLKNYLLTVKAILFSPKEFFEGITFDGGWKEPLIFWATSAGIYSICWTVLSTFIAATFAIMSPDAARAYQEMGLPNYFISSIAYCMVISFIFTQTVSALTTFAMHFLGGTGSFQKTYTVLCCCWAVMIYTWIPVLGWAAGLYFFYLAYLGLAKAHDVPGWKGILGLCLGTSAICAAIGAFFCVSLFNYFSYVMNHADNDSFNTHDPAMQKIMERYAEDKQHED